MSLIKWDYDQSVKKVSVLLGDLKAVTLLEINKGIINA